MSRETREDLDALRSFVRNYSLAAVAASPDYDRLLSQQHRRYLALLVILAEFDEQRLSSTSPTPDPLYPSGSQLTYIQESASDVGQAIFCWMHGGYKACRIILRSSVETFIKGMACNDAPSVLTETRLYKVFETANATPFFFTGHGAGLFSDLNARYGQLSTDVHTARSVNMNNISALKYFPTFDVGSAKSASENVVYTITRFVVALCLRFNAAFHAMHHRNKETVLNNVPAIYKRRIQNIDT
jgi:hypothetical protein